jgi:creatinine amidohydrolase/Fe(II)-dependent formamide hydrolase-like protein
MLRRLPFVRDDFASLRSDEYPIRLWTVAVFLFGALPILRTRRIGRLLIGDEFDTTVRVSHNGITHYDGLYDQSRYFDYALTRYFLRKGWGVSQFSVLRPLSEILIEKVLVERYPDLQSIQTSCHATHKEDERIGPCGRCEKCRRIVGMLMALGADPTRCGYSKEQIDLCMRSLAERGVHQEGDGVRQLAHLLKEKGMLDGSSKLAEKAREVPEIMKLRFDNERSPLEAVPVDLRKPLLGILLQHAAGAVVRKGRKWAAFDPLESPVLLRDFPFEPSGAARSGMSAARPQQGTGSPSHILARMSWPEAKERFKKVDVALLPVGAIEQHGPHLPLDTDAFDADYLARRVAEGCKPPRPLVLPPIHYGVSYHHEDFSGTLSVGPDTLSRMVHEIGLCAARHGIRKLVIINGHGGNGPALHFAAQMINRDSQIFTCVETGETSDADISSIAETLNDVHAGEIETSTALAVRPELVRLDAARKHVPRFTSRYLNFSSKRSVGWYSHTAKISRTGVLGDPTRASSDKGRRMWEVMIKNLIEFIEDLKKLSLDELHQKRY